MSDTFATDLVTKLETVTALATSSGMAVGGKAPDPALTKIPLPAAWVILGEDKADDIETGMIPTTQSVVITYIVMIYVPYLSQTDLINTQIPLMRAARSAIHATKAPNGNRWKYNGQKLALINVDRMAYEQRYTVRASM
ncbi:MAG: hypothetical protein B7Z62_02055 [Deltaproteobacteria bacterium 37-65-8]|nr:MAG: hypothetical protein B7Z62_02055 [Deltaproteobacteria bacterium 37-65-8]